MSLGDSWGLVPGSPSKLNIMTVPSGTGSYLASLDFSKHKLLVCTASGSGFTKDHVYLCETDGSGVLDIFGGIASHKHYSASDGGQFGRVLSENGAVIDTGGQLTTDIDIDFWSESVAGTGSTEERTDHSDYGSQKVIKVLTGATSGSTSSRRLQGLKPNYMYDAAESVGTSQMQAVVQVSHTTSINARWGIGVESLAAADDNNRKYGFNLCTSVNGNWFARSASGSTRSDSDMGVAFTTAVTNISATYNAEEEQINYYIDFDDLLEKTDDIPLSGVGSADIFRVGVKNSTAADRNAWLLKLRLSYYTTDNWW